MTSLEDRMKNDPMEGQVVTPCATCSRRNANGMTCEAFPKGIPDAILDGQNDHTKPFPGDHGLLYRPIRSAA